MKLNWKIRIRNPLFWAQIVLSVAAPVMAYFGLSGADMTSWPLVWSTLLGAVSNPYVCVLVLVSVWNALNDPTTAGLGDSARALSYTRPGGV